MLEGAALAIQRLRYAACLRGVDAAIGSLCSYLEESGLAGETMIVVTADHGEGMMERGLAIHGYGVYDELVRVPLVIHYPGGIRRAKRIPNQVRHIDLMPTIVDYTGARDEAHREGVTLRPLIETGRVAPAPGRFLPSDHQLCECISLRAADTKCIRRLDCKLIVEPSTGTYEFYDLKQDPGERDNLRRAGVTVFTIREVDERGMREVIRAAVAAAGVRTGGIHVSFDLDVLDPEDAPGTGTPVEGGLSYREAHLAMEMLADTADVVSADVVEVNPILDTANRTADLAVELIQSLFGKRIY